MKELSCKIGNYAISIRSAKTKQYDDLDHSVEIYNHYIEHSIATFHVDEQPLSYMQGVHAKTKQYDLPFLVAIKHSPPPPPGRSRMWTDYSNTIGFAYALPHSPDRPGWDPTVDISLYLRHDATGYGIGGPLLDALLDCLARRRSQDGSQRIREVLAVVALNPFRGQKDSAAFYRAQGFTEVGTVKAGGMKFGKWIDVTYFQKSIVGRLEGKGDEVDGVESEDDDEDRREPDSDEEYSSEEDDLIKFVVEKDRLRKGNARQGEVGRSQVGQESIREGVNQLEELCKMKALAKELGL